MRSLICFFAVLAMMTCVLQKSSLCAEEQSSSGAQKPRKGKNQKSKPQTPQTGAAPLLVTQDPELESVLSQMDSAAAMFHSAQADLESDQYSKVVDETDTQKGRIYFRRTSKELQMAIHINGPEAKHVLLTDSKVRLYQPKIDQVTEYALGKNSSEMEGVFALGFGGRGHDLLKSFDVKLVGNEMIDGVKTAHLELIPKTDRLKNIFSRIELWIDPMRGVPLRQKFWEPSGDYRLARYSDVMLNQKLPDDAFKLKTTSRTKVVTP